MPPVLHFIASWGGAVRNLRPRNLLRRVLRQGVAQVAEPPRPRDCLAVNLAGKRAIVTGSTGQLGRAMARTLAACGADVALHYHSSGEKAEALAEEIRGLGTRACTVQADVGSLASVQRMQPVVEAALGPLDIVVVNAISWHSRANVLDLDVAEFEKQHRTSVLQAVHLAKVFVPGMVERRWGRIIGISSEVAMQAGAQTGPYTAAKRGMDGVLRVLARELGPHQVTVNQVAPGWVISDRDREESKEHRPAYEANVPMRRRGFDQDVANAVAFLASNLANFITGVYLPVCGGNVMPTI